MNKLISRLFEIGFLKAVFQLTSATIVGQVLILAGLPVIARLFDPEAFGLFAIFNAITGILLVISSMRMELAIPLANNHRNASQLFVVSILITIILAILVSFYAFLFSEQTSNWLGAKGFENLIWLVPIALTTGGIFKALNYLNIWESGYRKISQSKILQSLTLVLSQIFFGLIGLSPTGLAWGLILGQTAGAIWLAKGMPLFKTFKVFHGSPSRTLSLIKANKNYAKYDVPAAFTNAVSQHLPSLFLAVMFSPGIAGFYYLADRLLSVPAGVFGRAVGQVLHGHVRSDKKTGFIESRVHRTCAVLALLIVTPMILIHFYATPLFLFIFGESWGMAGEVASWLVFGIAVQFVYSPISIILVTTNGQHKNLSIHVFLLIMKALGLLIGYVVDDFILAVQGMVFAQVLGYGLALLLTIWHMRMLNNTSLPKV